MSGLVDHLLAERTPLELAKELAKTALDNAHLKERVARLECELFWLRAQLAPPEPGVYRIDAAGVMDRLCEVCGQSRSDGHRCFCGGEQKYEKRLRLSQKQNLDWSEDGEPSWT